MWCGKSTSNNYSSRKQFGCYNLDVGLGGCKNKETMYKSCYSGLIGYYENVQIRALPSAKCWTSNFFQPNWVYLIQRLYVSRAIGYGHMETIGTSEVMCVRFLYRIRASKRLVGLEEALEIARVFLITLNPAAHASRARAHRLFAAYCRG